MPVIVEMWEVESLIVLGLVPGTNIQITFFIWLVAILVVFELGGLLYIKRRHLIMFFMLGLRLRRQLAHLDVQQFKFHLG